MITKVRKSDFSNGENTNTHNAVVTTTIRVRFDSRKTACDRATTIQRPKLRPYGAIEIRLIYIFSQVVVE